MTPTDVCLDLGREVLRIMDEHVDTLDRRGDHVIMFGRRFMVGYDRHAPIRPIDSVADSALRVSGRISRERRP